MKRTLVALYAGIAYVVFLASFLYAIGFVGNLAVPKSIDSGGAAEFLTALAVDVLLLGIFAVQHSTMARPAFKKAWTKVVPRSVERSTYVLLSSLLLFLLFWQWRALPGVVWEVDGRAARAVVSGLFWIGWLVVLLSTFMISHLDLFGVRQAILHVQEKAYSPPPFQVRGFYLLVRHPIMLGFIIAFWAIPTMSIGHLVFAIATTGYILIALQLEEKDLLDMLGEAYRGYRERVPMLIPWTKK
jgi:protein-S-isoprenylcysteine O-methyltransferase Ste14